MMTDIDNFKEYNDSLGHAFGDEILGNFGRCLCSVFGHDDVYRYGGDEFLVIADNYNDETFLKAVNRVRSKFNNCTVGGNRSTRPSVQEASKAPATAGRTVWK